MIPNFVLYIKKAPMMQAALAYVEELRDHHVPMLRAANMHELRLAFETRNMILSAEMKLTRLAHAHRKPVQPLSGWTIPIWTIRTGGPGSISLRAPMADAT